MQGSIRCGSGLEPRADSVIKRTRRRVAERGAIAALGWALVGIEAANAQAGEGVVVDLGECVELETPEARMACYEAEVAAVLAEREAAAQRRPAEQAAQSSSAPRADAGAERRARRDENAAPTRAEPQSAEQPARAERRSAAERARAATAATADPDEFISTVADLRETVPNSYVITLANGQVWRQTQPKWYPLRIGDEVRVYSSTFGFRLTSDERKSFIRVERAN